MGDYFSKQAASYSRYRPEYPEALYERLMPLVPNRGRAWDCGAGTGQVARVLAKHFGEVLATDLSAAQIEQAQGPENVTFSVATAEQSGLAGNGVDLIVVGQAIHWFDFEAFWQECRRVAKPNAVLAFWTYGLADAGLPDNFERHYHSDVVGAYWPPGREHVDCLYRSIQAPFTLLADDTLTLELDWSLEHYLGYLASWSATQRYRDQLGKDPLAAVSAKLVEHWAAGPSSGMRHIRWPLALKVYSLY